MLAPRAKKNKTAWLVALDGTKKFPSVLEEDEHLTFVRPLVHQLVQGIDVGADMRGLVVFE